MTEKPTSPTLALAGNQWISGYLITALTENDLKPDLVLNVAPQQASNISGYTNLAPLAGKLGIPLYRPHGYSLKSDEDLERLSNKHIDVLIVFGWQRLIPEWLINHCKIGVFGVHGGPYKPPRNSGTN
jgi:methionyl-tRNA formyltransferase